LNKNKTSKLLLEVEKLKNKPLSEKAVFMGEYCNLRLLYSKRGNCFQLKKENFEAKGNY
jgi:aminopeptidase N